MRILTEKQQAELWCKEWRLDKPRSWWPQAQLEAQARESYKEIGEKMMTMASLSEFHNLRMKLIQGEMPE